MKNLRKILCVILCTVLAVVMVPRNDEDAYAFVIKPHDPYNVTFGANNFTGEKYYSLSSQGVTANIKFNGFSKIDNKLSGNNFEVRVPDGTYLTRIYFSADKTETPMHNYAIYGANNQIHPKIKENANYYEISYDDIHTEKCNSVRIWCDRTIIQEIRIEFMHEHNISYTADQNKITGFCNAGGCGYPGSKIEITLDARDAGFSENAYGSADVYYGSQPITGPQNMTKDNIVYYLSNGTTKTTYENSGASGTGKPPVKAGSYIAKYTLGSATAEASFHIVDFDTYSINYDANGGSGAPASVSNCSYKTDKLISDTLPQLDDFEFLGWAKSNTETNTSNLYAHGCNVADIITRNNESVTLYAVWGQWTYYNSGNAVTAEYKDPNGNVIQKENNSAHIELVTDNYYADETPIDATFTSIDTWNAAGLQIPAIKYYNRGGSEALASIPTEIGQYTAKAEIASGVIISSDFDVKTPPWKIGKTTASDIKAYISGTDLVISGSGEMMDWTSGNEVPWLTSAGEITLVDLDPNVTGIGSYAFASCPNLADINLENVKNIGQHAFDSCSRLTSINLANAESVGENAFSGVGTPASPCNLILNTSWNKVKPTSTDTPWYGGYFNCLNVEFSITFDLDGGHSKATPSDWPGNLSRQYKIGTLIDNVIASWNASDMERSGYAFDGWEITPNAKSLTADTTVKAKWIQVYLAKVDLNGGIALGTPLDWNSGIDGYSKFFIIDTSYAEIFAEWDSLITKNGYTFKGWTPSVGELTENTTFKAEWNQNSFGISSYSRSNEDNGKEALKEKIESAEISMKSTQTKLNGNTAIKITWTIEGSELNLADLDNYEIFRSTKKYSGYGKKPYFTSSKPDYGYYVNNKGLKKGKTYYYKVRGFKVIDGEKYYTPWSKKCWRTVK